MTTTKFFKLILLLLGLNVVLMGCTNKETEPSLTKVEGEGLQYSEYFKSVDELDKRENVTYYKPLPIETMVQLAPESMENAVQLIDWEELPFEVNQQVAYLNTSKDKEGNIQTQVQLTYLSEDSYGSTDDFFILTVTEVEESPLEKYDFSNEKVDTIGNELRKEILTDEIPIFHQVITENSALIYSYYNYLDNRISLTVTNANEFYGYYNGHLYHAGYSIEGKNNSVEVQEKLLQLTREFMLGKTL